MLTPEAGWVWLFSPAKIVSTGLAESDNKMREGKNSEIPPAMNAATAITLCLCLTGAQGLFAQSAETPPVGFNVVECLPQSDTYCGVPFVRPAVFQGVVQSVSAGSGQLTITPERAPDWTAGAYPTLYFVRLTSGVKAGMYYQVAANTTGDVTVDLAGDAAAGVQPGDTFRIHPFWTLATLFPPATQSTVVPATGFLANQRRTELLMPDVLGSGINLAPTAKYYIYNGNWRKAVSGNPIADDEILYPDSYFIVRHGSSLIEGSTFFVPSGTVELNPLTTPLATRASGSQDNFVVTGRPVPIKLSELDLVSSGAFVSSTSTLANGRRDSLLVFDNASAVLNKAPAAVYYYYGGNWRKSVSGNPVADDDVLLPSHGLIIRKYQTGTDSTQYWTHSY